MKRSGLSIFLKIREKTSSQIFLFSNLKFYNCAVRFPNFQHIFTLPLCSSFEAFQRVNFSSPSSPLSKTQALKKNTKRLLWLPEKSRLN